MSNTEKTTAIFEKRLNEYAIAVNASWQALAWLCKQAASFAIYERKYTYLYRLWEVVRPTRYAAACRKLLSALLYGVTIHNGMTFENAVKYTVNGRFNLPPITNDEKYHAFIESLPSNADYFQEAARITGLYRKHCGMDAAQCNRLLKYS